jgi:hypothetical protein
MVVSEPALPLDAALAPLRDLAGEIVVAVDARAGEATVAGCAALADRLYRIEFTHRERHLAWLLSQCRGEWVLPLEPDELLGFGLLGRLGGLLGRRDVRQVWAPRRWLFPDGRHALAGPPWGSDLAAVLLRNDGALRFPGLPHVPPVMERPFELVEEPVYELALLAASEAERRAAVVRAEVTLPLHTAPGGGRLHEALLLPELRRNPPLRPVDERDAAAIARALTATGPPPRPQAPPVEEPPLVRLAETDRFWDLRPIPEEAYRARLEPLEDPIRLAAGEVRATQVRIHNDGTERWPWDFDRDPAIRVGHRVRRPDGSLALPEGRTAFPRTVEPGDAVVVPVGVEAPGEDGAYVLELDLVHEDVRWFECAVCAQLHVAPADDLPPAGPRLRVTPRPASDAPLLIPRTVHRVWLGGAPLPDEHGAFGETFERHNPGWAMRLWGDEDLDALGIGAFERELSRSPSELSDLIRYEVLRRHGGVYVDTDVECLRPLAPLLAGVEAFAALELPGRLGTAVLGAVPGHPLFERAASECRRTLGLGAHSADANGPYFLSLILEQDPAGVTVFGPEVFYPYLWDEPERRHEDFPDAYAVHHWALSWWGAPTG